MLRRLGDDYGDDTNGNGARYLRLEDIFLAFITGLQSSVT